ncbi:MAG: hypothetical protein ABW003_16755, partial [Microvirga sp.]
TGEKFLEPSPAARDRLEDAAAILNLHRTQVWLAALRYQDLTTALPISPGELQPEHRPPRLQATLSAS